MKALLEYSVQNYGPLPSDLRLRRIRSRTLSRPSPYPIRTVKTSLSSDQSRPTLGDLNLSRSFAAATLQSVSLNHNTPAGNKPFSPVGLDDSADSKHVLGPSAARPRVPSIARRNALGWSKRNTAKKTSGGKENVAGIGQGFMMT